MIGRFAGQSQSAGARANYDRSARFREALSRPFLRRDRDLSMRLLRHREALERSVRAHHHFEKVHGVSPGTIYVVTIAVEELAAVQSSRYALAAQRTA